MVSNCHAHHNQQNGIYAPGGLVTACRAKTNSQSGSWSDIFVSGGLGTNNL